jgi:hypothetical protein
MLNRHRRRALAGRAQVNLLRGCSRFPRGRRTCLSSRNRSSSRSRAQGCVPVCPRKRKTHSRAVLLPPRANRRLSRNPDLVFPLANKGCLCKWPHNRPVRSRQSPSMLKSRSRLGTGTSTAKAGWRRRRHTSMLDLASPLDKALSLALLSGNGCSPAWHLPKPCPRVPLLNRRRSKRMESKHLRRRWQLRLPSLRLLHQCRPRTGLLPARLRPRRSTARTLPASSRLVRESSLRHKFSRSNSLKMLLFLLLPLLRSTLGHPRTCPYRRLRLPPCRPPKHVSRLLRSKHSRSLRRSARTLGKVTSRRRPSFSMPLRNPAAQQICPLRKQGPTRCILGM